MLAATESNPSSLLDLKQTFFLYDLGVGQKVSTSSDALGIITFSNSFVSSTASTSSDIIASSSDVILPDTNSLVDFSFKQINEQWPTPWNLVKISNFYQFEISSQPLNDIEVHISYDKTLAGNKYKQIFYYDNVAGVWYPLKTQDNVVGQYVSAKTKFKFARLAVFSYPEVIVSGQASWYKYKGGDFAASPDFAKGSILRVYNTANNKFVDVTINDYGPDRSKLPKRVVDLDKKAFAKIASTGAGIINVRVEVLKMVADANGEILGVPAKGVGAAPDLGAKAALLISENNGTVLFAKNASTSMPIASLTKVLAVKTFLDIADNKNRLNEKVVYSSKDEAQNYKYCRPGEAEKLKIKNGDKITIKDLIYSSLVASTNNTVETLVRVSGLSRADFIAKMNSNAKAWGATKAKFIEPTGLAPENKCSSNDYAAIMKKAASDATVVRASATIKYTIPNINGKKTQVIYHSPSLLDYYRYQISLSKTGYLNEAGYCLATRVKSGNDNLLAVTFGNKTRAASIKDSSELINFGLANIN